MKGVDPSGLFGGGFPDPTDDSPSQDKYYTSSLTGRGTGIPAANKFFRFASSFIPGVGQLLGFHEAVSGCDVTGEPVSNLDRVLGGLPAAGAAAGVLGGAGKALKGIGAAGKISEEAGVVRTFTSKDPLVADIANAIEALYPGHVTGVNTQLGGHEIDILTKNAILEVKAGGSGLTRQVIARSKLGLPVIAYSPKLGRSAIRGVNNAGGIGTNDLGQLLGVLKP